MQQSLEQNISARFCEVMADHVGPSRRWRFKRDFGKEMGMISQELYKIEQGGAVQIRYLFDLNRMLNVNLNWLIAGKGEKYLPAETKKADKGKTIDQIRKLLDNL